MSPLRAWTVEYGGIRCLVAERSRGRARARAWRSASESGFGVRFIDGRTLRAPQFDELASRLGVAFGPVDPGAVERRGEDAVPAYLRAQLVLEVTA